MPNAALILETALLILAAFLVGCVIGALARRITLPKSKSEAKPAEPATQAAGAPLVTAPTIAPLPATGRRPRSAAERLAAAAGRDIDPPPRTPAASPAPEPAPTVAAPASVPEPPVAAPEPVAAAIETPPAPAAAAESVIILPPPTQSPEAATVAVAAAPDAASETPAAPKVEIEPDESFVDAVLAAAPDVEPVPASVTVLAEDVPVIDEAAHVVERTIDAPVEPELVAAASPEIVAAAVLEPEAAVVSEPDPVASSAPTVADPPSRTALVDVDESAAMRAIEGGWTPRRRTATAQRPIEHPEYAPSAEVDDAMQTARTAVAAATAAAAAAIAESQERPRRPTREGLSFEQRSEEMARSFLAAGEGDDALPLDPAASLDFEPAKPVHQGGFGRPEGLPTARDGKPDNLKLIRGVSPSLEASLNGLGVFHFDQIANWDQKAVVWMDNHLSLRGRIAKEHWLEQARELGSGRAQTSRPVKR
jgi:predicted flap endonuclease-1-like 5' DNA nuclease